MTAVTAVTERWQRFWHAPVDPLPFVAFRQAWAWSMLIYFAAWARFAPEWLTSAGYHPSAAVDPRNAPGVPLIPEAWLPVVGVIFFGALGALILGFARKPALWVLVVSAVYVLMVDPIAAFTINRLFVIGLFILAIAPEPQPVSTPHSGPDSKPDSGPIADEGAMATEVADSTATKVSSPEPLPHLQRAWPTRMLQVLVVAQYFASGLCKIINGDWLDADDILWMQVQGIYMTDATAWMLRHFPHWVWGVLEALALWFELLAPLLFGIRRLWPVALCLGIGLHVVVAITMDQLIYFSLQMCCFYLLFIPPEWIRRLRLFHRPSEHPEPPALEA